MSEVILGTAKETVQSLYAEQQRSEEYADDTLYSTERLYAAEEYWREQLVNPERSPRSNPDIHMVLARLDFELMMRNLEASDGTTEA